MSPPDRLAKLFPFYLMDVNGFGERIEQATRLCAKRDNIEFLNVVNICLEDLQEAFKTHPSWSDLNNEDSDFVCFLRDSCPPDLSMDPTNGPENNQSMNMSVADSAIESV